MKDFLNCPIPRLLEYERILNQIYDSTRRDHPDRDDIPEVIDIIRALGRETEPGVNSSKQKVQIWQYHSCLVFKPGEVVVRGHLYHESFFNEDFNVSRIWIS